MVLGLDHPVVGMTLIGHRFGAEHDSTQDGETLSDALVLGKQPKTGQTHIGLESVVTPLGSLCLVHWGLNQGHGMT